MLTAGGEPTSIYLTAFAFDQAAETELAGILGPAVLPLDQFVLLGTSVLDAEGVATELLPIPTAPALAGVSFVVQGLAIDEFGTLSLSAPVFAGLK